MYINIVLIYHIILLCMKKVRVRWCTCSSGKLIDLLFLFLLSILFLKPNVRTYKKCKDCARSHCNGNHFSSYI